LNWLALEAFASLAETLSFTETARRLSVTQPNISKLIANLEDDLAIELFNRGRKRVALTPAGHELRQLFSRPYAELRDSLAQFKTRQQGLAGIVRVGCLPEVGIQVVFPHLLVFQRANPRLEIEMVYASGAQVIQGVTEGRFDLGIATRAPDESVLRAYPLLTEDLKIWGAPEMIKRLAAEEWETAPWVDARADDGLARGFLKLHRKRLPFRKAETRLWVNSYQSMIQALVAGVGFAVLPEASASAWVKERKLAALPGFHRRDELHLFMVDSGRVPERAKAVRDHLFKLRAPGPSGHLSKT
jgi:DNA-binding transcriptional LysR family regulator